MRARIFKSSPVPEPDGMPIPSFRALVTIIVVMCLLLVAAGAYLLWALLALIEAIARGLL